MYRYLRKIFEKISGYPADSELSKEYIWAWRFSGIRPTSVEWSEDVRKPGFRFDGSNMSYFCFADKDGVYFIGNVDTDGIFDESRYKRKACLIKKYLEMPNLCSKEEAVLFCAKAVKIEADHMNESVNISDFSIEACQHSIFNFG